MRGEDWPSVAPPEKTLETPPLARGRHHRSAGVRLQDGNTPACAGKTRDAEFSADPVQKHPRLRGEDRASAVPYGTISGNTPACAGKTDVIGLRLNGLEKHPRLRGEDLRRGIRKHRAFETPPLARGRPLHVASAIGRSRNTPACAGKTRKVAGVNRRREKHPRLRGEDADIGGLLDIGKETPPLARGRHGEYAASASCGRNTPAFAGKTHGSLKSKKPRRKHPRLRGEDDPFGDRDAERRGNTPACAGKTGPTRVIEGHCQKHPRLRGEDASTSAVPAASMETPPLARGRPPKEEDFRERHGNTPACAGKTSPHQRRVRGGQKHPRLRGEDYIEDTGTTNKEETPPLARGRRPRTLFGGGAFGNTPACAGKTK